MTASLATYRRHSRELLATVLGDMVMAMITVSWANGINSETPTPGYELNMALGVLALVVAFFGAGRFSIDALVGPRVAATDAVATN